MAVTNVAEPAEERLPRRHPQHEDREGHLEPEPPRDHAPADAPAIAATGRTRSR